MTVKPRASGVVGRVSAASAACQRSGPPRDHVPLDDEPETDEERRAVALTRADRARGIPPVPLDEVLREFDSTLDPPNGITTEP